MPLLDKSSYKAPLTLLNGHVHTVACAVLRSVADVDYSRERIATADGDFLDIDWSGVSSESVAIISHGLEGSSHRPYVLGMARALNQAGWDVAAWNFRGCSGEPNTTQRLYHSGETNDLNTVVEHVVKLGRYRSIALIGFSLGGNITLKYLGEPSRSLPSELKAAVCFSVSCDLRSTAQQLAKPYNRPFMKMFLRSLRQKIRDKIAKFPHDVFDKGLDRIATFLEFDEYYTAPLHGFRSAEHYWQECSCARFLPSISVPTLLVNAADDPMLSSQSYPFEVARKSSFFTLEVPQHGGHIGFANFNRAAINLPTFSFAAIAAGAKSLSIPGFNFEPRFWSELRAVEFLKFAC